MKRMLFLGVAACLLASGCEDSKNPLSDPQNSKVDQQLIGVWRERTDDGDVYYHIGLAGAKFPAGMMRIVQIKHGKEKLELPLDYLAFSTVIGDKTYLNVVLDGENKQVQRLNEKGWKAEAVDHFTLIRYQVDGDKLTALAIDETAKKQAVADGKIKGVEPSNKPARFTDTSENVARFVTQAGDGLWNTQEPLRLERVGTGKK